MGRSAKGKGRKGRRSKFGRRRSRRFNGRSRKHGRKGRRRGKKSSGGQTLNITFVQAINAATIPMNYKVQLNAGATTWSTPGANSAECGLSFALHPEGECHAWSGKAAGETSIDNYQSHNWSTDFEKYELMYEEFKLNRVTIVIHPNTIAGQVGAVSSNGQPVTVPRDNVCFHYERNETAAFDNDDVNSTRWTLNEMAVRSDFKIKPMTHSRVHSVKFPTPKQDPGFVEPTISSICKRQVGIYTSNIGCGLWIHRC